MDDELRLLRAMSRRDASAWALMYERHVGDVFGLAYHLLGRDRSGAEDLCQEVWLLAIDRFDRFDPARGRFRDWILGIARIRLLEQRRGRVAHLHGGLPDAPCRAPTPLELLETSERADVVRAAMLLLEEGRRRVLLDKYVGGLSVARIADRSGQSAKAVESLLTRARNQLRGLLQPYFQTPEGGNGHEPGDDGPA